MSIYVTEFKRMVYFKDNHNKTSLSVESYIYYVKVDLKCAKYYILEGEMQVYNKYMYVYDHKIYLKLLEFVNCSAVKNIKKNELNTYKLLL